MIAWLRSAGDALPDTRQALPASSDAPGLLAAGDHVQGPYPATLEGAVRSGTAAAGACLAHQAINA